MKKFAIALIVGGVALIGATPAMATKPDDDGFHKVTICHNVGHNGHAISVDVAATGITDIKGGHGVITFDVNGNFVSFVPHGGNGGHDQDFYLHKGAENKPEDDDACKGDTTTTTTTAPPVTTTTTEPPVVTTTTTAPPVTTTTVPPVVTTTTEPPVVTTTTEPPVVTTTTEPNAPVVNEPVVPATPENPATPVAEVPEEIAFGGAWSSLMAMLGTGLAMLGSGLRLLTRKVAA